MLNIYTNKALIPKDKSFIFDVDSFFNACKLRDTSFTKEVLSKLEIAEFIDTETFKDRFGRGLYLNCLSTGTKILLTISYFPDLVVNGIELGYNGLDLLVKLEEGNIYLQDTTITLPFMDKEFMVNGELCKDSNEANYAIGGIL